MSKLDGADMKDMSVNDLLQRLSALKTQVGDPSRTAPVLPDLPPPPPVRTSSQILREVAVQAEKVEIPQMEEASQSRPARRAGRQGVRQQLDVEHMPPLTVEPPLGLQVEKGVQASMMASESSSDAELFNLGSAEAGGMEGGLGMEGGEEGGTPARERPPTIKIAAGVSLPAVRMALPEDRQRLLSAGPVASFLERANEESIRMLNASQLASALVGHSVEREKHAEGQMSLAHAQSYQAASTRDRHVYDLSQTKKGEDRILAGYGQRTQHQSLEDPLGLLALWNILRPDVPERTFTTVNPINAVARDPFNADLVAAGDSIGGLSVWDLRSPSPLPCLWTIIEETGHQLPIQSLFYTGSSAAYQLLSLDEEGRACLWTPGSLSKPTLTFDLPRPCHASQPNAKLADLAPTITPSAAIMNPSEGCRLTVGCYDGSILEADLFDAAADGAEAMKHVITAGAEPDASMGTEKCNPSSHTNLISSLSWMADAGTTSLPRLLLSGGLDGQVKLWSPTTLPGGEARKAALTREPLFSYSYPDFVSSLACHPKVPGAFACALSNRIDLWSIGSSASAPVFSLDTKGSITRLMWGSDGNRLWTGSTDGVLELYGSPLDPSFDISSIEMRLENCLAAELEKGSV